MPDREHPELDALRDAFEHEREIGRKIRVEVTRPLHPANQRLADFLGAEVVVVNQLENAVATGRTEGHYLVPGPTFAKSDGPRVDWIDYRASIARVHKREQNGDEAVTCSGCGTETDVTDIVHSPKCTTLLDVGEKKASDWDEASAIAAMQTWAEDHDGDPPKMEDWRTKTPGCPTYAVVVRLFGSWNEGITAAGLEARPSSRVPALPEREPTAREERDLVTLPAAANGVSPPADAVVSESRDQLVGTSEVASRSVSAGGRVRYTRELLVEEIKRWNAEHGSPPTFSDWQKKVDGYPVAQTVYAHFGSWSEGIKAAGLTPGRAGRIGKERTKNVDSVERQTPPIVWAIKVNGTGLRYRTADEALVAAAEIEHDGEQVAESARRVGDEGKADQAIDASRELAQKIREACGEEDSRVRDSTSLSPAPSRERLAMPVDRSPQADEPEVRPPRLRCSDVRAARRRGSRDGSDLPVSRNAREDGAPACLGVPAADHRGGPR